ncbi:MAG: metal ABC transporter permease [Pseudomonadota bacterium]
MAEFLAEPDIAILVTGALVGVAAAILGPFLILRQSAMMSDAIAHAILFGIMLVWLATGLISGPVQILGAGLAGLLCVWLTEILARTGLVRQDAAIGLVFPVLFALGVLLQNLFARDVHIDAHTVLLGEIGFVWLETVDIAGMTVPRALFWMAVMTAVNAGCVALFWKELKLTTFDPVLAEAFGMRPRLLFYLILFLTSATAVAAFDAVGVVLFLAFVIVPPAAGYLLTDRLGAMIGAGVGIALVSAGAGHGLAVIADVSIGGMMALMTGGCFAAVLLFGPRYGMLARLIQRGTRRRMDAARALVVHLLSHEDDPRRDEENLVRALETHLGWRRRKASAVLGHALEEGLILRETQALHLTEKGRDMAVAILAPWQR